MPAQSPLDPTIWLNRLKQNHCKENEGMTLVRSIQWIETEGHQTQNININVNYNCEMVAHHFDFS